MPHLSWILLALVDPCFWFPDLGAAHIYLLDFIPDNLPELKETIQQKYPDVRVSICSTFMGNSG